MLCRAGTLLPQVGMVGTSGVRPFAPRHHGGAVFRSKVGCDNLSPRREEDEEGCVQRLRALYRLLPFAGGFRTWLRWQDCRGSTGAATLGS